MNPVTYRVNEPTVIAEEIEGETIVLNFDSGHYYSMNPAGSTIWTQLRAGASLSAATQALARQFAIEVEPIEEGVRTFVVQLVAEGLLRPDPRPDAAVAEPTRATGEFAVPAFEKFTDMEQLLLLDPIHEVGDAGWPYGSTRKDA